MDRKATDKMISEVFLEIAEGIQNGSFEKKVKIGITTLGSEHGEDEMIKACNMASKKYKDFEVVIIGSKEVPNYKCHIVKTPEEGHKKMDELLDNGEIDGCVTQHYDFPIGVSTVGGVVTPGLGKTMLLATTTGTTATARVKGMILNAISGIATAKALGIEEPTVGILNLDGARGTYNALKTLKDSGYEINFAESLREDGGAVMRGNDLLAGTPDVMVCDSLTGNLLIKMFSSYTTGGNYETLGTGYGPGIGDNYNRLINIVSRASGAPLICEALNYCAVCAKNNVLKIAENEYKNAMACGLDKVINDLSQKSKAKTEEDFKMPPKKVVTYAIPGVDILELDDAVTALGKAGIYSESGMGCTGPVILVSEDEGEKALEQLKKSGYKS